jgi:RHS repeat-associated protein
MLAAAKEEIFSALCDPGVLFPLAADPAELETRFGETAQLRRNSHQGITTKNPVVHRGSSGVISTTALGIEPVLQWNGVRSRYTGKERDAESGLDYFEARYMASMLGRFMSADPRGGHPEDPQSLNRYAYARSTPTTLTDPTGLDFYLRCSGGDTSTCQGGHAGTMDDQGNFTAAVVTSDSIRAGQNSANVDQNGIEVTTGGKTYSGQYFDNPASHTTDANGNDVNHNPITLRGSGPFVGFSFNINGDCNGTCLASGRFSFKAPRDFTGKVLELRGSFRSIVDRRIPGWGKSLDEWEYHPGTEQYRFGKGPSPHFSLPDNPKDTVPTVGPFHVDKDAPGLQHLGCAKLGVGCQQRLPSS